MNKLAEIMELRGLKDGDLAELVGAKQPEIWRLRVGREGGGRKMTKEWADRLAPHLGVSPVELLYEAPAALPKINVPHLRPTKTFAGTQEDGVPYSVEGHDAADKDTVAYLLRGRPNAHPWTMKSDVLALKGICAGDILIIDQSVTPKNGDVVLAQVEEGVTARTVFRVYQMPNIIGAAFDPTAIRPEIVDGERVRIAGVMTDLLRRRG